MFETAMFFEAMEKMQRRAHTNSRDKGFWDGPENNSIPTKLCLIHSEVSEWLEAYRKDPTAPTDKRVPKPGTDGVSDQDSQRVGIIDGRHPDGHRPITVEEEEAADVFIRLLDLCEFRGIDLARVTLAKMQYNATRPHKHGGKKV
jgi:hypothetical protein